MPDKASPKELPIPIDAISIAGSAEVLRAWIVNGGLHVSLISGFERPELWGLLLADVARHASRCFAADGICTEEEAMRQIERLLMAELAEPTDFGTTGESRKQ